MSPTSRGPSVTRLPGTLDLGGRTPAGEQSIEALLAGLSPASADLARAALGWMLPEGRSLAGLGQVVLQEFLWYQLPMKWMVETSELHEIAQALADLFTAAGLDRYAALCRAPETHRLLDSWREGDLEPALRLMKESILSSGVDPPDTPLMGWGSALGVAEFSASRGVSQALEQAIDTGEMVPGGRGWKQHAARITEVSLTLPRLDLHGGTLLQAVRRERAENWASGPPPARSDLLTEVLPLLDGEVPVPVEAAESLRPLLWLLDHIGDGFMMTRTGLFPGASLREANDAFGWFDLVGLTLRTETDLPELLALHGLARRARLMTTKGRRGTVSAQGRLALRDPSLLWRIVVADIFAAETYEGEGAALAAATMLRSSTSLPRRALEASVGAGLEGRWQSEPGDGLGEWAVADAMRDFGVLGDVFGWLEHDDDWQNRLWALTSTGRLAGVLGLQIQAQSPRHRA